MQNDDLPLIRRQTGQGPLNDPHVLGIHDSLVRPPDVPIVRPPGLGRFQRRFVQGMDAASPGPRQTANPVGNGRQQVTLEVCTHLQVILAAGKGDEHIVHRVFGRSLAPCQAQGQRQHVVSIPGVDPLQGLGSIDRQFADQPFVIPHR